jgi:probable phosphoglycerate mutase
MIYIVRHGQTDWNLEGRYAGRKDIPLNDKGIEQANIIKEELKSIKFDKVFSSPLSRAYQTAKIICDNEIIIDDRIIERSNGDLEGKLKTEVIMEVDFNDPNEKNYNIESIIDFRKRITSFFDEITSLYKDENILIVTHAGVGIYARCYFEGEPNNNDYSKYKIKNCEIIKYDNK